MNLLNKLHNKINFTDTEIEIANYILTNKEAVIYLSTQEIAKRTFSSHSSIIRLCQKLGFNGYKDFKIKLLQELQQNIQDISNIDTNSPFNAETSPIEIGKNIAELMKETIDLCFIELDNDTLNKFALYIKNSERFFIFATADSEIRARSFQTKLYKINKYATVISELSEWVYHVTNIKKSDFTLFLTYHGSSKEHVETAKVLKKNNSPFGVITSMNESELTSLSNVNIHVPSLEEKFKKIATFSSQMSFEFVLNVLYSCYYKLSYDEHTLSLDKAFNIYKNNLKK